MNAKANPIADDTLLPHPPLFQYYPLKLALHLAPTDMRATQTQVNAFRSFAQLGDPLADALVEEMRAGHTGKGYRMFERALQHGIASAPNPGSALAALFREIDATPYWLDTDKFALRIGILPSGTRPSISHNWPALNCYFPSSVFWACGVMGFRFTDREIEAVIHLWRYVGHLIGVHKDLLPASEADAWRLMWMLLQAQQIFMSRQCAS